MQPELSASVASVLAHREILIFIFYNLSRLRIQRTFQSRSRSRTAGGRRCRFSTAGGISQHPLNTFLIDKTNTKLSFHPPCKCSSVVFQPGAFYSRPHQRSCTGVSSAREGALTPDLLMGKPRWLKRASSPCQSTEQGPALSPVLLYL